MADQWELDTLAALNEKRRAYEVKPFKWSNSLEEQARYYTVGGEGGQGDRLPPSTVIARSVATKQSQEINLFILDCFATLTITRKMVDEYLDI